MIAEMKKITLAVPRSEREAMLQFLQEETVIHLAHTIHEAEREPIQTSETSYHIAQLQFALDFIASMKRELGIKNTRSLKNIFAGKPVAKLAALEEVARTLDIPALINSVQHLNDDITAVHAKRKEIESEIALLEPWASLQLNTNNPHTNKKNYIHRLLIIKTRNEASIEQALLQIPTSIWQTIKLTEGKKRVTVYGELVAHVIDTPLVEAFEQAFDASVISLPLSKGESVDNKLQALISEKHQLQSNVSELHHEATKFIAIEQDIRFAYDALLHHLERERTLEITRNSPHSMVLSGWIPTLWVTRFTKRLHEHFPNAAIEVSDVTIEEKTPVLFQNNSLVKPFEAVTDLYGKPAYHELDPTGPLALFFLISFGLALTDAGYGIVIMLATFLAQRYMRLKRDMQKMMRLLFFGGAATVILGAVTGGWFSINLDALPEGFVKSFLLSIKLIDPLKQPIVLLGIIFGFGIVQLSYAWIVRGIYHWKKGEKAIAIMDDFSWTALILFICLSLSSSKGLFLPVYAPFFKMLMYAGFLFMVVTQGRTSKNIFLRIATGAFSITGLIAFVSDTLSYSRLLALGLATGIIGLVVNLIASMVHEGIPVVGVVLAGVVLLVGHVFNLGINALGAFIHSGRLQFVEFFPKFMEGGGVAFRPLGRVGKYVDNPKDFIH